MLTEPVVPSAFWAEPDPAVDALGVLHGNCAHCHHGTGDEACATPACLTGLWFQAEVGLEHAQASQAWQTGVGARAVFGEFEPDATCRIAAGHPERSVTVLRMATRGSDSQMPPIGTERVDPAGLQTVSAWISDLPSGPEQCEF